MSDSGCISGKDFKLKINDITIMFCDGEMRLHWQTDDSGYMSELQ